MIELANKIGYERSMITKIEQGKVDLTQSKIVAFAKALETTPAKLMGWEDNAIAPPHADIKPVTKRRYKYLGEIAAVIIDDEATLKRVYKYEDHISLNAENPIYKPIQVRYDDAKNIKIIGRAIAATIHLK